MANKKLMDEDLRQANKSTSTLKTQAFKLANGTRYKATAADGEMGKFAGNNPAYPAGFAGMQTGAGAVVATNNMPRNRYNPLGFQPGGNGVFPDITAGYGTGSFIPKGMIMSDRVVVNQFPQVTSGSGFQTRSPFPPVIKDQTYQTPSSPYTGTAGYWAGNNQTSASSYPATSYMAPNQQVNSTTNTGAPNLGQPQRPEGTYNPNNKDTAAQWRAYWNWEAANPQAAAAIALAEGRLSSAPVVMTREQIWQMKAAQRRKRASMNYEAQSYVSPVSAASPYTGTGEFYSTILNTGSG